MLEALDSYQQIARPGAAPVERQTSSHGEQQQDEGRWEEMLWFRGSCCFQRADISRPPC